MKIALSQRIMYQNGIAYDAIEHGWYHMFKNQELFFLPNSFQIDFDALADYVDVFIITGGDDSVKRRTIEIKFATKVMQRNKPIIGVCHGAFLLTDLLGGTVEPIEGHSNTNHNVIYGQRIIPVNSFHDLGITKLHETGIPLCVDEQGHIEAFIDGKVAGVVWHPERMEDPWLPTEILEILG
jgi:gamma-glutamyl-gamma-aminobutyrate hydrolase PuuD